MNNFSSKRGFFIDEGQFYRLINKKCNSNKKITKLNTKNTINIKKFKAKSIKNKNGNMLKIKTMNTTNDGFNNITDNKCKYNLKKIKKIINFKEEIENKRIFTKLKTSWRCSNTKEFIKNNLKTENINNQLYYLKNKKKSKKTKISNIKPIKLTKNNKLIIEEKIQNYQKFSKNLLKNLNYNIADHYNFKNIIGNGSFSEVRLVFHKKLKVYRAAKILKKIDKLSSIVVEAYFNEKSILSKLNHKNIIKFYDFNETVERIFIIIEYFKSIDLKIFLKQNNLNFKELLKITKDIANSIYYLHSNNIIHRDIKLENILINDKLDIKLIDFGFSYQTKEISSVKHIMISQKDIGIDNLIKVCGTPLYMSPEILNNNVGDKNSDIWAFGISIFKIFFNKFPFYFKNTNQWFDSIKNHDFEIPKNNYNPILINIIKKCLIKTPKTRINIVDIISLLNQIE